MLFLETYDQYTLYFAIKGLTRDPHNLVSESVMPTLWLILMSHSEIIYSSRSPIVPS